MADDPTNESQSNLSPVPTGGPPAGRHPLPAHAPAAAGADDSSRAQADRPPGGERRGRHGRGDRQRRDESFGPGEGLDEVVVRVYRCAKVVKGGRRFSFAALAVVGDRTSKVGVGYGKANEVPSAVDKARKQAVRNMVQVKLDGTTIPHRVKAKYRASQVILLPAGKGTGVIAGASVRAVMEMAGVKDVLTKVHGSTSPKNLVKAAFNALTLLRSKDDVARLREVALT